MKKNSTAKILAFALLFAMMFTMLVACNSNNEETSTTTNDTPTSPEVTTGDSTTENSTTTGEATTTGSSTTTDASTTTQASAPKDYVVENLSWHLGYVGSDTNSSWAEKINPSGGYYSYSDIINLGPAGSTITFTDDNTNANGDTNFASAAAYVFSSWKKSGGSWVLDTAGYNVNGTDALHTDADGARTYTYTSTKENECIRLCFRSGQSSSFTPDAFPAVKVTTTKAPTIESEKEPEATTAVTAPVAGTELNVKWNAGYVGSSTNPYGYANKINASEGNYAYTDVIEIAKKGTKVTFTDTNRGSTSGNAYVLSFWKKSGADWEIDTSKYNIPGGGQLVISSGSAGVVYTYISAEDNECIRFCFRSNGTSNQPKIYSSETNEPGTLEGFEDPVASLNKWIEEDKKRAYYEFLKGKTFTVIGDSYLAGNGLDKSLVWPALLAKKYDMVFNNYGMNGSTMSNYVTTNNPMVNRYSNMVNNNPDIVFIEGGRNDYNKNVPLGTLGSTDTKTMKGAAQYLITKIQEKYPNAVIICMTVWEVGGNKNSAGNYCSDYGKALIEVCQSMNIPCINAMDQNDTGVKMTDASFRAKYCMTSSDISHLNADGMKLVLPVFEKHIAQFYEAATATKG